MKYFKKHLPRTIIIFLVVAVSVIVVQNTMSGNANFYKNAVAKSFHKSSQVVFNSPKGGEQWPLGSVNQIIWFTYWTNKNVKAQSIDLVKGAHVIRNIAKVQYADGSEWGWKVPADLILANDYKIKTTGLSANGANLGSGTSNAFSIVAASTTSPSPSVSPIASASPTFSPSPTASSSLH